MSYPSPPPRIGKKGSIIDIGGRKQRFTVLDEITQVQSSDKSKVIYLQLLQFDHDKRIELRLAYYIIGRKRRMKGKWVWGQFATMMPVKDFKAVIRKARKKGWV